MTHAIDRLARRYHDAPDAPVGLWHRTARVTDRIYARLVSHGYRFVPTDEPDTYRNAGAMLRAVQSRVLRVYDREHGHPVFMPEENYRFRAVHDVLAHGVSESGFTFDGELAAYRAQCTAYPSALWPVLYSEIVGQAAVYYAGGGVFGEQRTVTV